MEGVGAIFEGVPPSKDVYQLIIAPFEPEAVSFSAIAP